MAAGSTKFGTFGGVFTPSILTILGVIMYLRLPQVVGQAGLIGAVLIILLAHVISISTGLSISSIATDKKVGAGGPYYIISRSLGLPIGGTIGLALFVGLSFSISLYAIGFSESFLATVGLPTGINAIRICGTLTIVGLTIITFVSTALAIKSQYVIMALIVASLIAVFLGAPESVATAAHLQPIEGFSFGVAFAIFFPAVTGFTAGVNMSGDLKDPKKSLPLGTMSAIGVGLIVYLGLAVFLALRVPGSELNGEGNTRILGQIALFSGLPGGSWPVLGGIWGATLSSALGSILGAPRILQALSVDRVTPRFLAKGAGKSNEPRRALFVAFAIGEAGILIGELDAIANIVSMFFIATYGMLNLVSFIESWASTDFRPSFKIPKTVSLVGAVTCIVIMIVLNIAATIGAAVLLTTLFLYLQRRQLTLESGDTWEGVWSSMIRSGIHRLSHSRKEQRNFRPNALCITGGEGIDREALLELGETLVRGSGVLTEFELLPKGEATKQRGEVDGEEEDLPPSVYHRQVPEGRRFRTIESILRFHGYTGLEPNVLLADWAELGRDPARFAVVLEAARSQDLNVLLYATDRQGAFESHETIDVYWAAGRGPLAASVAMMRLITTGDPWNVASVRFLLVVDDPADADPFYRITERLLGEARLEATVKVLSNALAERSVEDWARTESSDVDLVVMGMPAEIDDPASLDEAVRDLASAVGNVLLIRPASTFPDVLISGAGGADTVLIDDEVTKELPPLELPSPPEIAAEVTRFAAEVDSLLEAFHKATLARSYTTTASLVEAAERLVAGTYGQLEKGLEGSPARLRRVVSRAHSTFLHQAREMTGRFEKEELAPLFDTLEHRVRWLLEENDKIKDRCPDRLAVTRPKSDFAPSLTDSTPVRRFKRNRRLAAAFSRRAPVYDIPLDTFHRYYLDYRAVESSYEALEWAAATAYDTALELGKTLTAVRLSLGDMAGKVRDESLTMETVAAERSRYAERLATLAAKVEDRLNKGHMGIRRSAREIAQALADDLDRMDVLHRARKERRVPRRAAELVSRLNEVPAAWRTNQTMLVHRAELELIIGSFQHRLAIASERTKEGLVQTIDEGLVERVEQLVVQLGEYRATLDSPEGRRFQVRLEQRDPFDVDATIEELVGVVQGATSELPESLDTIGDEGISRLAEDRFEEAEVISVSVRRLVEFLVQAEFVGKLKHVLARIPTEEARSLGVVQDVLRLVAFNVEDLEFGEEEGAEPFAERMRPVVDAGIGRIEKELEHLAKLPVEVADRVDEQLRLVVERTEAYAITGSDDSLKQYTGSEEARKEAISRLGRAASRLRALAREGLGLLLYRRSAGVLFTRRLQANVYPRETVVERVQRLVRRSEPSLAVLEALPFYYQQPFLGKTRISADFWVGRKAEMREASEAVARWRRGSRGTLVVTGERSAGKTSFCRLAGNKLFGREAVSHLFPPRGGSVDLAVFTSRLGEALDRKGTADEVLEALPEGSALVIHDLELWWERSHDGLAVLDEIRRLHTVHGHRVFFVLSVGVHTLRFFDRIWPGLTDGALSVIECGAVDAAVLKDIVMLRHRSTGLTFDLGARSEGELADWRLARLFGRHFDYSGGRIGVALQAWVAHISEVREGLVEIEPPRRLDVDVFHEMRMDWVGLLVELLLHVQLTTARLERITGIEPSALRRDLDTLIRMGIVTESQGGVLEVNRYVDHFLTDHLVERGIIE